MRNSWSDVGLVEETPTPIFARLERGDDWVAHGKRVLPRMLQRRRIAAADMPAGEAQPQVNPGSTELEALLAALGCPRYDRADLGQVRDPA
jgi:hypothetical protein